MSAQNTVSVLGLGAMGTALASAFISNAYPTTVWNRTASKASDLVARGASLASSPAACISAASDLVILCLTNNDAVRETLSSPEALKLLSGKTVVNLTNGTPSQARDMAAMITPNGAEYVDGGIMAIPPLIGTPSSFILYSGSEIGFKRVKPNLTVLGQANFVSSDNVGTASLLDSALLASMYGMQSGAFHGFAMAKSSGLSATRFATEMLIPWLSAMTQHLGQLAQEIDNGEYPSGGASLGMQVAAMPNILGATREARVWEGMLLPIIGIIERRVANGGGQEGTSALIEEMCVDKNPPRT